MSTASASGRPARGRRVAWVVLSLLAYTALAVALCLPAWRDPSRVIVGSGGDAAQTIWYLRWVPHAVGHGVDPWVTHALNRPDGVNLAWAAGLSFLPSLVLWPVTTAFGAVVAYDVYMTAALALSAWVAALVLRRWTTRAWPAWLGGLLYGFSPYMIGHALGHPHLDLAVVPPLLLLCLDQLVLRDRVGPVRLGLAIGALAGVQVLMAEEILASSVVVALGCLVALAVVHRQQVRARTRRLLTALAAAIPVAVALAVVPTAIQFFGPQRIAGRINSPVVYSNDLLSLVVPTRLQAVAPGALTRVSDSFSGNISEWGGYVGLPLVVLLTVLAWRRRDDRVVRTVGLLAGVAWVLSLGPFLHVAGHNLYIPLPEAVVAGLPVLTNLLPTRISLFVFLFAGLLLARLLDLHAAPPQRRVARAGLALACLGLLVPALPLHTARLVQPSFFSDSAQTARLAAAQVVLVAPYPGPAHPDAMVWQADADVAFAMPGGYVLVPGRDGKPANSGRPTLIGTALDRIAAGKSVGALTPALRARVLREVNALGVHAVVVGPMPHRSTAVDWLSALLGAPPEVRDGVAVWWSVPPGG